MPKGKTCKGCCFFSFKVDGGDGAWGYCLNETVQAAQRISTGLCDFGKMTDSQEAFYAARDEVQNYARIFYREDTFGCVYREPWPREKAPRGRKRP